MNPGNPWLPAVPVSYAQPEIKLEIGINATGLSPLLPALPTFPIIELRMAIREQRGRGETFVGAFAQREGLEPGRGRRQHQPVAAPGGLVVVALIRSTMTR